MRSQIKPCLWFDTEAEQAADYYVSIFPDSRIVSVSRYGEAGPREPDSVMVVEFDLDGQPVMALNGGPEHSFSEAISLMITCDDADELDHYWSRLTDGGEEGPCGWCKDRFGLSWQVVPSGMAELFSDPDRDRARRAMEAMMRMRKLDLAAIRAAADGGAVRS